MDSFAQTQVRNSNPALYFWRISSQDRLEKAGPKNKQCQKGFLKSGHSSMRWCQVMMKEGKQREWSCQSCCAAWRKAPRELKGGLSHSVALSSNFKPPVSEDSATGASLPEALQPGNTDSITLRHTGSLCSSLPGRNETPDAAVHIFFNNFRAQICQEKVIIIMPQFVAIRPFLRCPTVSVALPLHAKKKKKSLLFDKKNNCSISISLLAGRKTMDQHDFSLVPLQMYP